MKPIVWTFKLIAKAWEKVKKAWKGNNVGGFFKRIGKTIILNLLKPLELALRIANKLSKGKVGGDLLAKFDQFKAGLETPENQVKVTELNTSKTATAQESLQREERIEKQQAEIFIRKDAGVEMDTDIPKSFPVSLSTTF